MCDMGIFFSTGFFLTERNKHEVCGVMEGPKGLEHTSFFGGSIPMLTQLIQTSIALALPFAFLACFFHLERMISSLLSFKLQIFV